MLCKVSYSQLSLLQSKHLDINCGRTDGQTNGLKVEPLYQLHGYCTADLHLFYAYAKSRFLMTQLILSRVGM